MRKSVLALLAVAGAFPLSSAIVGSIAGSVTDDHGIPQVRAAVTLLGSDGRALRRVFTNDRGAFVVDNLFPGLYGVRVAVPSFLPALKERIRIEPGVRSFVAVQLANLFATFQLSLPGETQWRDRTEDWKWVLRTAAATRPVLRFADPLEEKERQSVLRKFNGVFSDTQGMVQLSAGDGGRVSPFGSESDIGTAFAVATSLFGNSSLLVSGNLGYGSMYGAPSAGFHTSYSREMAYGAQPEVSVTVRQLFRPLQAGQALFGPMSRTNPAVLQTFTLGFQDRVALGDLVKLEYGFLYDSISFLDRMNYVSPFGKLTYRFAEGTHVVLRYAGGAPQVDAAPAGENALGRNLSALSLYPRMSLKGGRPALQRGEHMEIGLHQDLAIGGTVELAAFRDVFTNAALTTIAPPGFYQGGDILPDLFTDTSSFNAGSYDTTGYRAGYSRKISDHVDAGVTYSRAGVLTPQREALGTADAAELRSMLKPAREHSVSARLTAQIPQARTRISSSYQWGSRTAVTAPDPFNLAGARSLPGLNVVVRQPLPQPSYVPGKFEATAEFRNLLADGYVSLQTVDGRRLYLIQSARSFRGGVNFVF